MVSRVEGRVTFSSAVRPANAYGPILVTPSGIVTCLMVLSPRYHIFMDSGASSLISSSGPLST